MRLICKTAFFVAVVSTLACHDLGPPPLPADFVLDNINGRALPTFLSPIPESPTIISSTLHLDGAGQATMTEHRVQMAGGDLTFTSNYHYVIIGNKIQFSFFCPSNADCITPPTGTISGSQLSLDMSGGTKQLIYNFQLTASN